MVEHRRSSTNIPHPPFNPWPRVTSLISMAVGSYVIGLGILGWWAITRIPRSQDAILLDILGITVALTVLLLASIRLIVVRHLITPLQQHADHDDLTELCRPGVFWELAERQRWQAIQAQEPLAFVFIDLDDFKQVNDTYGHLTGDALLRAFGTVLRTQARNQDTVGRLGGEEFGWVMPGTTMHDAQVAAERLLTACQALSVATALHGATFSAGIAGIAGTEPEPPSTWDLARCADRALYQAKAAGKAQVQIATGDSA